MKQRNNKIFILSLFLLNLFQWVSLVDFKYGIPLIVKYVLSISILGLIIYYRQKNPLKPMPGSLFYPLIILFVIWSLLLIIYALIGIDSLLYLQRILGVRYFFIPYLLPLVLLFTKFDLDFLRQYFHYIYILIIPALLIQLSIVVFGISQQEWYEQTHRILIFDIGSSFLLLTAHLSRKKHISYFIYFYFLIWTILWSAYGRRGMLIESVLFFIFMIFIRLRSPFLKLADRMRIYFSGLLIIILFLSFGYLLTSSYAFQRGMTKEGFNESRSSVFEGFFLDFNSTTDLVFGRGLNGTVLRSIYSDTMFTEIENGILTILLKGGFLYLIPFLILMIRAIYLGLFRSNNDLVKALACLILIYIIMMAYFNLPDYSSKYIFIWISVSICFTPEIRNYSNNEIIRAINSKIS